MRPPSQSTTGVAITNPLVLYRSLLATKRIEPDPAQHRLALHLQKLYENLKDYEPIIEYRHRLQQISKALANTPAAAQDSAHNGESLFAGRPRPSRSFFGSLFQKRAEKEHMALTRALTSHEQVLQLNSPKGLMLHGEVGTGKSMLIDLFADCLPTRKKKRLHFTTFMLETFAKLEQLRRSRQLVIPSSLGTQDDYSLLWLARDMISSSPILFLDEFQLPDRAASKIITNLMTGFFHLGGVLIATSNRMPEELAKAAGVEFTPPPSTLDSLRWRIGLSGTDERGAARSPLPGNKDFAAFLEVLKARCDVWQMESTRDYRRQEAQTTLKDTVDEHSVHQVATQGFEGLEEMSSGNIGLGYEQSKPINKDPAPDHDEISIDPSVLPKHFLVRPSDADDAALSESFAQTFRRNQAAAFEDRIISESTSIPWTSSSIRVYGRDVLVPRQHNGVTSWTFLELCESTLGPADYITLASTYHTFIVTDVPVLSLLQKNEARRFITLLDALYEARCKLLITADAGPDSIFFPETSQASPSDDPSTIDQDQILPETLSEIYQDATAPFRPNISAYEPSTYTGSAPSEPDFTHSRLAGIFADDQLEDGPPNSPRQRSSSSSSSSSMNTSNGMGRGDSIYGLDPSIDALRDRLSTQRAAASGPDFSRAGTFTGEDEKFAYKRARSRLWEMCGARWWARGGDGWWQPLDPRARTWERPADEAGLAGFAAAETGAESDAAVVEEGKGASRDVDDVADGVLFRDEASLFRVHPQPPPKFGPMHAWGMMKWGKKAGAWGQGVEGLDAAREERQKRKQDDNIGDRGGENMAGGGKRSGE